MNTKAQRRETQLSHNEYRSNISSQLLQRSGLVIAGLYVLLDPLMIQNSIEPFFLGFLGKLQLVDLLSPIIFLWLLCWSPKNFRSFWASLRIFEKASIVCGAAFVCLVFFRALWSSAGFDAYIASAKYLYLYGLFLFFYANLQLQDNGQKLIGILYICLCLYVLVSLAFYALAFTSGESNALAYVYDYFPYTGTMVRLIGTWSPTSKLMAVHLLLFSLIFVINRGKISRRLFLFGSIILFISLLLTMSRPGLVAAIFLVLCLVRLSRFRAKNAIFWASVPPIVVGLVLIQVVTFGQFDRGEVTLECGKPYEVVPDHPHYGWYGQPTQCDFIADLDITYSSYYLMKRVGVNAWLSEPLFGLGPGSYSASWSEAVDLGLIPPFFDQHVFPMAQSTYITLLAEMGVFGLLFWSFFIFFPILSVLKDTDSEGDLRPILCLWLIAVLYTLVDCDVQNFRFVYYMIPLLIFVARSKVNDREFQIQ